jgi:hypothetical protein
MIYILGYEARRAPVAALPRSADLPQAQVDPVVPALSASVGEEDRSERGAHAEEQAAVEPTVPQRYFLFGPAFHGAGYFIPASSTSCSRPS